MTESITQKLDNGDTVSLYGLCRFHYIHVVVAMQLVQMPLHIVKPNKNI